jgi:hypothetical protein
VPQRASTAFSPHSQNLDSSDEHCKIAERKRT